jgi:hypothetical protein
MGQQASVQQASYRPFSSRQSASLCWSSPVALRRSRRRVKPRPQVPVNRPLGPARPKPPLNSRTMFGAGLPTPPTARPPVSGIPHRLTRICVV